MNRHKEAICFWCKKEMNQRIETYNRQLSNYGHSCCKKCFGKEPTFKAARSRVMSNTNPFKGKKHTEDAKLIIAKSRFGKPPWNKGIRKKKKPIIPGSINRWIKLKNEILERDCKKCWKCESNQRLEVHHIVSKTRYPELYYDELNCITLCHWCHKEFHKRFSRYSFQPQHTIKWLNEGREPKDFVVLC